MSDNDTKTFTYGGRIQKVRNHLRELLSHREWLNRMSKNTSDGGRLKRSESHDSSEVKKTSQTIVEKIVSDHIGYPVFAGEKLDKLPIDILFFNEVIGPPAIKDFISNFPNTPVFYPKKIFFIPDHNVPSSSVAVSEGITFMEEFAKKQKIKCYKEGDGIEHVVLIEDGYIVPKKLY